MACAGILLGVGGAAGSLRSCCARVKVHLMALDAETGSAA